MSEPTQTCQVCGDVEVVRPDGRGFPPDIATRRLSKRCATKGHRCIPKYRAGLSPNLDALLAQQTEADGTVAAVLLQGHVAAAPGDFS